MRMIRKIAAALGLALLTAGGATSGVVHAQQAGSDPAADMFNMFNPLTMMNMPGMAVPGTTMPTPGMAMPGYGAATGMGANPFQAMMVPGNWVNPNMYMQFMHPNTYMQMMNPATYMAMMNPAMYMQLMNPMAYMPLMNPASYMAWMNPATYTQALNAMMQMGHAQAGVSPSGETQGDQ